MVLAAAAMIASRTREGQGVVSAAADAIGSNVRGIRNNNPGNIRHGASQWQGMRAQQADSEFVQFTEMRYGVRASAKLFRNYQSTYNLRTTRQLIGRWAPPSENDTDEYVRAVAGRVGVAPDQPIDLTGTETAYRFLRAVFRHECGVAAELIPESTIREGIALA